ncbi:MAG TPA: pitrilysin family protein [Fibrobacteria bacterium]|nr:pitrilysin family protein [Fibrobacteria bacterium]
MSCNFSNFLRGLILPAALCLAAVGVPVWANKCMPGRPCRPISDLAPAIPKTYREVPVPADAYEPPYPGDYRVQLSGGAVAYLVPDSTLDLVRLSVYVPRPNLPAKPGDVARLRLYSALLKDGGTRALSPERLEDSLEFVAADLSAGIGAWQAEGSFDALSKDADAMLGLLGDVVLQPGLEASAFKISQREMLEGRKHRYATPGGVMGALYERVMFGSHPLNWAPTEAEVAATTSASLSGLSGSGFSRDRLVHGVSGRIERTEMIRKLEAFVARFPAHEAAPVVPPFRGPLAPGVYLVDKPFAQASIRIAAPGVKRPDPDYYRLLVASEIFGGGGFTSRLALRVRSNEGLAYSVGSDVESDYNRRANVRAGLQTKAETGALATRLVLDEMRRMADSGITDVEMEHARETMLKSLPSLFDSPASTARIFAQSEAWGRSPEHFREYRKILETMTRAEVEDAFRRYFKADSMRIVVVGPKETLLKPDSRGLSLKDFGKVTEITETELDKRE